MAIGRVWKSDLMFQSEENHVYSVWIFSEYIYDKCFVTLTFHKYSRILKFNEASNNFTSLTSSDNLI